METGHWDWGRKRRTSLGRQTWWLGWKLGREGAKKHFRGSLPEEFISLPRFWTVFVGLGRFFAISGIASDVGAAVPGHHALAANHEARQDPRDCMSSFTHAERSTPIGGSPTGWRRHHTVHTRLKKPPVHRHSPCLSDDPAQLAHNPPLIPSDPSFASKSSLRILRMLGESLVSSLVTLTEALPALCPRTIIIIIIPNPESRTVACVAARNLAACIVYEVRRCYCFVVSSRDAMHDASWLR